MGKSWVVGSAETCDLVLDRPGVSGRHCRLTRDENGYVLEDLSSTNGIFVNGLRLREPTRVGRGDEIMLGRSVVMPWPAAEVMAKRSPAPKMLRLGRDPENDVVINLPMVSGRHARIVRDGEGGGNVWIEDLGSANGTFVGSSDCRNGPIPVLPSDTIHLGTLPISGAWLLAKLGAWPAADVQFCDKAMVLGRDLDCDWLIDAPQVSGHHARLIREPRGIVLEDLGSANGTYVNGRAIAGPTVVVAGDTIGLGSVCLTLSAGPALAPAGGARSGGRAWWMAALLGQTVVLGVAIVLLGGRSIVTILGALGLAASWFGLATALSSVWFDPDRPGGPAADAGRWAVPSAWCLVQCAIAWLIASVGTGLHGPVAQSIGLLLLASWVGLALGALIAAICSRPIPSATAALMLFVLMAALARAEIVADITPSRWAFEGLLLLEIGPDAGKPDLASDSGRMGLRACTLALGLMVVGLAASAAFIAGGRPADSRRGTASLAPGGP